MRALLRLVMLLCSGPALAQIVYSPTPPTALVSLDAATVRGKIHVRLLQTTGAPWTYTLDGVAKNVENTAPYVLVNEIGNSDNLNLWDTATSADGPHNLTAQNATTTLTAAFVIANVPTPTSPPTPPSPPAVTGSALLSWTAPTLNVDGSPLTDLAGFRIYYGLTTLDRVITIANPATTSYTVPGLTAGSWNFALTAFTVAGAESLNSAVVSKLISATVCTTPRPPDESQTQTCPSGTVGSWPQTRTYASDVYPQCWTAGSWIPAAPPVGACKELWIVAVNGTATTRPVFEAILPITGTAKVRGNREGSAKIGAPCGDPILTLSGSSYRAILDADAGLTSPTYRGRQHIAVCTRAP